MYQEGTEKAPKTNKISVPKNFFVIFAAVKHREIPSDYIYSKVKHREVPFDYLYSAAKYKVNSLWLLQFYVI